MPSSEGRNDASIWFPLTFFKLIAVGFPGESNSAVMSADATRLSNTLSLNVTCKKVIVDRWNIKGTIHSDNNGRYPQFESNPRFMHFIQDKISMKFRIHASFKPQIGIDFFLSSNAGTNVITSAVGKQSPLFFWRLKPKIFQVLCCKLWNSLHSIVVCLNDWALTFAFYCR